KKKADTNHVVKIVNYKYYTAKQANNFANYLKSKNKEIKTIPQDELVRRVENWNFIKQPPLFFCFCDEYTKNTHSIEEYRKLDLADYDEICIDGGVILDEDQISDKENINSYKVFNPQINTAKTYKIVAPDLYYSKTAKIRLVQGSQGMRVFRNKYKIIWKTRFNGRFQFSYEPDLLLNGNQSLVLSSDNYEEILFLLSLLNSRLSLFLLEKSLKIPNEAIYLVALKSIKQYIRIPIITTKNQAIKNEIIKQTEVMLNLEKVILKDIVNFSGINVQKFDMIRASGGNLILTRNEIDYKCKIKNGKNEFVQKLVTETFFNNGMILNKEIILSELKTLSAIDFDKQAMIKNYIDDLVFALYFNISLLKLGVLEALNVKKLCQKNKFYEYIF
ncbi:MAG: hypothetical protein LBG58_09680, partial [Planctomycetaceae bacterium]|nr:hypothetical protein [Planctomycetaceae bacterium]